MSFSDEYLKLRNERLKKEQEKRDKRLANSSSKKSSNKSSSEPSGSSFADNYLKLREERMAKEEEKKAERLSRTEERKSKNEEERLVELPTASLISDDDDIAPTKKWYQGYFKKSDVQDDGYQFGDITKAKLASEQDVRENIVTGILGIGEKAVDALAWLAPAFNASQTVQNTGGVIWERDKNGKLVAKSAFDIDTYREQQNASAEFIKKDLYDEKKVAQNILYPSFLVGSKDEWENAVGINVTKDSVFGDKSDALLQSAGQMGATALMSPVVPWWLTTGATAFGSQAEEALNEGASYEAAGASAAIAAGAEVLTEKLGGIKFGGLTVTDKFLKPLTNKIPSKVLKALADAGIDAVGEGVEEYVTEICNQLGSSLYKEENAWEILTSEEAVDARIDSLVGGMIMGGAFGSVNTIIDSKKANLTETEQKVVDKVTEDRIAEESKKGKVNEAQKLKIREEVIEDMDAGRISFDTIEETLGGDTYKSYKDTVDSTESMKKELEELNNMKTGDLTGAQSDRLAELKGMNLTDTSKQDGLKNQLRQEVYQMTKGSRLGNSYGENYKRTQSFTADLSKYDTKQQEVIKRAVESGILNDTRRTHEFVDMVAKISADKGVLFNFANNAKLKESGFAIEGKTINGFVKDGNVTVNIQSVKALDTVVGHEITHVLEGTELYAELQQAVKAYATTKGEYDTRLQALTKLYEGIDGTDVEAELTADLVGDYLFTDDNFVNRLSTEHRNIFQKIFDEIKYLWKTATAGSKEARQLEKVKKVFEKAYKDGGNTTKDTSTKYHVSEAFSSEIDKVLSNDMDKSSQVKARDFTPDYLVQNGAKNLPMLMTQNHVKSVIYTEAEAKNIGLPTGRNINYHGLGKNLLVRAIDSMDNPSSVYRKDADTFIIITELTDNNGSIIIVPVRINGKGQYNKVYIDENHISSVYGKKNLQDYLARNNFEEVSIKEGTTLNEGSQSPNISSSFDNSIPQNSENAMGSFANSESNVITDEQNERGLDRESEVQFSISNDTKYMDEAISLNNSMQRIDSAVMEATKLMRERVATRMKEIKDRGLVGLPEDVEGNTFFSNSSYGGSEENTTICPRSLSAEAFVDAVSDYLGRPLTVDEQIYISQDLQGRSMTPECTYCYVATDRKAYRAFLGEYIKQRDAVLQKLGENPNADVSRSSALYREFLNGRKDTNPMYKRFKMWVDAYKNGTPMVDASHLTNMNKLMGDIGSEFGQALKPQIQDAMKYAQSASWAKKRVNYVAYNGHILGWKQDRINKLNSHYGLRMYSFSDFHPAFTLENMQMITDASVRGLKVLGYTKDTDFVEIFAPSGMNINISTFGFEMNGGIHENNLIGAEWEKAKELRSQYDNVGITFVATNDTLVEWALAQDWIDVVIPYHLVRTGAEVAKAFGYHNYTDESSDTKGEGWKKGDSKSIAPTEHNNDLETYLKALKDNNLNPRFERFMDNPNYMKLVNECRRSASESKPVQPKFNEDAVMRTLAKLEANGYYQPIGGSVDRMYEIAAEVGDAINNIAPTYSLSDAAETPTEYAKGNFYGKDIMLETEDIAPVSKTETTVAKNVPVAPVRGNEPTQETNKTVPPNDGGVTDNSSLATSTSTVSNNIRPQNAPSVNPTETISDAETPSGEMRSWVETSTESEAVGRAILPDDLDTEKIYYQPISNKKTLGNANARLDSLGYEDAVTYFNGQFANKNISLDDIALGERLIQEAVKKGDYKTAGELITDISILGTELGQKVQALSIIKRLTPEGQLRAIQRTVERGKTKGDKVFEGVEVTQEMTDQILKTYKEDGTYDQNELNAAVENVKQQIADQMKVTKLEQVNAWRYLSMLGNPKTHIRNLVSNIAMKGTVAVKNAIARTVEDIAPIKNRTKTWKRSTETVKEFSRQKAVELKEVISGGGKYGESAEIKAKREIFKNKILKGVYGFNSEMLSKEDWWFSRPAFTNALSKCLTANGISTQEDIDGNPEMVEKAIQYAIEQAQIATFQQTSWLANKIGEMERKNKLTNIAVGSILPFKKTPINIAKTGLNYSPLGFLKTAFYDVPKVKQGDMNASEMIDHLAQNITGSALTLAGYMLASTGFLNGAGEDDKEGKYDYQLGEQAYSINFGDSTYSLSWLSPVAMPLFVGANMYEQLVEKQEWNGNVVIETLAQTLDPLSEMSFLSSLDSTLSSYDSGIMKFAGIFKTATQSYIGQFAPTLGSQIATVMDDTKRSTKVSGDSGFKFGEETINKLIYKIPFLRETLEPSIDIWGNEIKQTENVMERAFETFLAPYAKRDDISSNVDAEIKEVYAQTGDNGLIPSAPYNYINYSGEKYNMSAKEYTDFKKEYGQTAFELLDELFDTTSYRNADSETKAELVNKVYDYARDEAKRDFFSDRGIEYDYEEDLIKGAIENDMLPDEYAFSIKYPEKYDFFKNNGISYNDYADADEEGKRAYTWAYDNPGKYTMSKVISDDFMTYYGYRSELNDVESDKDANGETVSGSKKTKIINYINDMDLDYGQKIILYRSMYSSKEDRANYNADIVDYLNSRDDISYDEMVSILEELDMKVSSDGTVTWD